MVAAIMTREPIYPVAYAATLVGLHPTTAHRWMRGDFVNDGALRRAVAPVVAVRPDAEPANDRLTFEELLTLRLVRAFREKGLSLQTIRKAAQAAATRYGINNPFVTKAFRTDGNSVFLDLERQGDVTGAERVMVHALTGQQQFVDVVEPSLFRDVVFTDGIPGEWFPIGKAHAVVVRPDRVFGAPHVAGTGIRTDVIADAVAAEGGDEAAIQAVAGWYGIGQDQVRDAVTAEAAWRRPRAA